MVQEELTKEDKKRVERCENLSYVKSVMESHKYYKDINVGDVYFIKSKNVYRDKTSYSYVSRNYGDNKDKFMVFHRDDDGFVFVKRINANGKLGKEVQCITTQYPAPRYELEPDPDYVDSILFENEEGYDPLKAEKENTRKKGRARRMNKKLEIAFKDVNDAFNAAKEYKVGDKLYTARTAYGSRITEYEVIDVEHRKTDQSENRHSYRSREKGKTYEDQMHNRHNLVDFVMFKIVNVKEKNNASPYIRSLIFSDFHEYARFYKSKPVTTDDV